MAKPKAFYTDKKKRVRPIMGKQPHVKSFTLKAQNPNTPKKKTRTYAVPSGVTSSYGIQAGYGPYRYVYINRPSLRRGRGYQYKFGPYDGSFRIMGARFDGIHKLISKHETLSSAQAAMRRLPKPRKKDIAKKRR